MNLSGTQWSCLYGKPFEYPSNEESIEAVASWHANAVRIPLNEDCWLGINGAPTDVDAYRQAIGDYVSRLGEHGIYAVLDLHWSAPGSIPAHLGPRFEGYFEMADEDHSPAFWESIATYFEKDHAVIFDLFNEPFGISWDCWLNGCLAPRGFLSAGVQQLVEVIRKTGAAQPIMLGGLGRASELGTEWLVHRPYDPQGQLIASVHVYDQTSINHFRTNIGSVAERVPTVVGEVGAKECSEADFNVLLPWADANGVSYLAWGWYTGACASELALLNDANGAPSAYGLAYREHLLANFPMPAA